MPLYMFRCTVCNHVTDISLLMEERDTAFTCFECGGPMKRKWGVAGVVIR